MAKEIHSFRHEAMNTWLELSLVDCEADYARKAATEVFREIDRLENILSRFREGSDVDILNKLAGKESVRVTEECWKCLLLALDLEVFTEGVFSIAFETLMDSQVTKEPRVADWLEMDPDTFSVRFLIPSLRIDLGGIGKGFALDLVANLLKDWELETFIIHTGTSSVLARGNGEKDSGWPVSLGAEQFPREFSLINESLSGSSLAVQESHILDLKSQKLLETDRRAWALAPSAAVSDALSTSFMLMEAEGIKTLCERQAGVGALVIDPAWEMVAQVMGVLENRFSKT